MSLEHWLDIDTYYKSLEKLAKIDQDADYYADIDADKPREEDREWTGLEIAEYMLKQQKDSK